MSGSELLALAWTALSSPIAQPASYHQFADQRTILGIRHFWNVVTNVPFAVIGLVGCAWLIRRSGQTPARFAEASEVWAWLLFFVAEVLTSLGSYWYHADPNNVTLVWDRLPLSLMLSAFFVIVVADFISGRAGQWMLVPWSIVGLASVLFWTWSESIGRGDLRPYLFVQFFPVVALPPILMLCRSRYSHSWTVATIGLLFVVAKIAEVSDGTIYRWLGEWSGHTVKHVVAAAASWLLLYGLQRRSLRSRH